MLSCHFYHMKAAGRFCQSRWGVRCRHLFIIKAGTHVLINCQSAMIRCLRVFLQSYSAVFAILNTPRWVPRYCSRGIMAAQEPSPPSSLEGNKPGFPKKILANNLEDKHLCNSCQKILRRPLQAQCGHRFCSFCFNKIVRWVVPDASELARCV